MQLLRLSSIMGLILLFAFTMAGCSSGGGGTDTFTVHVNSVNDALVVSIEPAQITITERKSVEVTVTATDAADPENELALHVEGPAFARITKNNDGTWSLKLTPTVGDARRLPNGETTVTVTATDNGTLPLSGKDEMTVHVLSALGVGAPGESGEDGDGDGGGDGDGDGGGDGDGAGDGADGSALFPGTCEYVDEAGMLVEDQEGKPLTSDIDEHGGYFLPVPPNIPGFVKCFPLTRDGKERRELTISTYVRGREPEEQLLESVSPATQVFSQFIADKLFPEHRPGAKDNFIKDIGALSKAVDGAVKVTTHDNKITDICVETDNPVTRPELCNPDETFDPNSVYNQAAAVSMTAIAVYKALLVEGEVNSVEEGFSFSQTLETLLKPSDGRPTGEVTAADLIAGGVSASEAEELATVLNVGIDEGARDLGTELSKMMRAGRLRVRVFDQQSGEGVPNVLVEVEPIYCEDAQGQLDECSVTFVKFCEDAQGQPSDCQTGHHGEPVTIFLEDILINGREQSFATIIVNVSATDSTNGNQLGTEEITVIPPATIDVEIRDQTTSD